MAGSMTAAVFDIDGAWSFGGITLMDERGTAL